MQSVYILNAIPGPVLPALPLRWFAFDYAIGVIYNESIPIFGL